MSERTIRLKGILTTKREEMLDLAAKGTRVHRQLEADLMPLSAVPLEEQRTGDILAGAIELHETVEAFKAKKVEVREIEAELE